MLFYKRYCNKPSLKPSLPYRKERVRKAAFTHAEVLITLGIVGVVAAMTLPSLVHNYQKKVVETRVQVFYSTINQAFRMAQVKESGNFGDWVESDKTYSYSEAREFLQTYLFPYIKYSESPECLSNYDYSVCFQMPNIGGNSLIYFKIDGGGGDMGLSLNGKFGEDNNPRNTFTFQIHKKKYNSTSYNALNFVEPYTFNWDGERESLLKKGTTFGCYKGCSTCAYCTKLIQLNNWKIPDDYPW